MILTVLANLLPHQDVNSDYKIRGKYNPELNKIDDLVKLESAIGYSVHEDTVKWVIDLDSILQYRFYHGTSRYNFNENWLAYFSALVFMDDLRMIVKPEDIMTKKSVVCNQMNIVFQHILKRNNVSFRSVGLNNHLASEVFYNNSWHYFDADYEPVLKGRPSAEQLMADKMLFRDIYTATEGSSFNPHFDKILSTTKISHFYENGELASNLRAFHSITAFLSDYAWIFCLILSLLLKYL